MWTILVVSLTAPLALAACGVVGPSIQFSEPVVHGNGSIRTYVTLDTVGDQSGIPVAIGLELTADAFEGLPADGGGPGSPERMAMLTFPEQASATPFTWLMLNWNPEGYIPPGVYDVPHHDFHFYIIEHPKLNEIKPGTCEAGVEGVVCETFERGMAPVPPEQVAPDYIAVVPAMGNHLIDPTSPEFSPTGFTHTFIYYTFDGEITFYEPMITREFLLGQPEDACAPIKKPQSFGQAGWYPTEYCMRYHQDDKNYTVSLEKFVAR